MDQPRKVIQETDADAIRQARSLLRSARFGALAVLDPADGTPLASRVALATDLDGTPLILVSKLSAHTGALLADPRCSLLVGEPGKGDPLAHARMTVVCTAHRLEADTAEYRNVRRRYLNRQPKAQLYVDFPDFGFFRLEPKRASLNGGFGKAYALDGADLLVAGPVTEGLFAREQGALDHMNDDHLDAIAHYASYFAKAAPGQWVLTGIDMEGIDIADGDEVRRIVFAEPLTSADDMHMMLVRMAREGRPKPD